MAMNRVVMDKVRATQLRIPISPLAVVPKRDAIPKKRGTSHPVGRGVLHTKGAFSALLGKAAR